MNTDHFKQKLLAEEKRLSDELKAERGGEAEENAPAVETRDEVAERFEDSDERDATNQTLTGRLGEVQAALGRIAAGTYGQCEVGHEPIEADRLEANPAARTCKKHLAGLNNQH